MALAMERELQVALVEIRPSQYVPSCTEIELWLWSPLGARVASFSRLSGLASSLEFLVWHGCLRRYPLLWSLLALSVLSS